MKMSSPSAEMVVPWAWLPSNPIEFEPFSDNYRENPYPIYRELRDHAPVHYAPRAKAFVLSRYDDVLAVGNRSADYFHPGKSIDFLSKLGELVSCALGR